MSNRIGLTPEYRCRELDGSSRQTAATCSAARTTFLSPARDVRTQITGVIDAFYTALSRHEVVSSVADEKTSPAVTPVYAAAAASATAAADQPLELR